MKRSTRIFLLLGLVIVFAVSWVVVLTAKSPAQLQAELVEQAAGYFKDEIYVLAAPLLEEAVEYNAPRTAEAENMLKTAYLEMIEQSGNLRNYISLLDKQMGRADAGSDIFKEAAEFYLGRAMLSDAYAVLKEGIARTQSEELIAIYENNRYAYRIAYNTYDDVTMYFGSTIGVCRRGLWGIASTGGGLFIPCEYDKVGTFSGSRAIVKKNGMIYAIDSNANRIALLKSNASDFGNLANDRMPLLVDGKWHIASGEFVFSDATFDWAGTFAGGYAAALQGGKWGLIDMLGNWVIPAEYDGVLMDELGRSFARGAVFVKQGYSVTLLVDGAPVGEAFDDAMPFGNEGYAAVKKHGKWGFIDTTGKVMIDFQFDDALSFGQHLAAVKQGDNWGYVSLQGKMAIEPIFLGAKSFANGNAPVRTEAGWQFISLLEYR